MIEETQTISRANTQIEETKVPGDTKSNELEDELEDENLDDHELSDIQQIMIISYTRKPNNNPLKRSVSKADGKGSKKVKRELL